MKVWSILNPHGYDLAPSAPSSARRLVPKPTVLAHTVESFKPNRVRIARPVVFIAIDSERAAATLNSSVSHIEFEVLLRPEGGTWRTPPKEAV